MGGAGGRATREISYAPSARSRGGRALIRSVENLTGRPALMRRARGYEVEVANGACFWQVMVDRYRVQPNLRGDLGAVPRRGPLVMVANHPFGILDGLLLGHVLARVRPDFRILAHKVFSRAPELEDVILPISFDPDRAAQALNLRTRRTAVDYLQGGGAIGVFPGGTVSTAARPMGRAMDPEWRRFTAKMIQRSGAVVVPVHFDGANSRLFQIASHMHPTLRLSLLVKEFRRRVNRPVDLTVGAPLDPNEVAARAGDPRALMAWLRAQTYALAADPVADLSPGYEFGEIA
ncbi:lysophospholipid acyltransferase family protein [Oceanomicrobium pacificus]|uniref:Acyltransferase n=1 Tax=Oceanomicrobium pacificus TaxID=2692916 RepID=A0A6B0TP05_9RHOB|nr:lysophospholipid acyltransferase family protein [Oceanomicrobium pacificus]MXU66287.1 acyltransferase [Oceanomicrobium pacificus]